MPARRSTRLSGQTNTMKSNQSTLSFNNKSSRVTKPGVTHPSLDKKLVSKSGLSEKVKEEALKELTTSESKPEIEEIKFDDTTTATKQDETQFVPPKILNKKKARTSTSSLSSTDIDAAFEKATKITDSQIKKYWANEEASRLAPRVHQSSISTQEKILRHFDLSSQYGPCMGISRLNRWKRAFGLGLKPPMEVVAVLIKEEKKGAGRSSGEKAYVDELSSGRGGLID